MISLRGLDTETIDGTCYLLGIARVKSFPVASFDEIMSLLYKYGKNYICFNLDYDASAILKYLPDDLIFAIVKGFPARTGRYSITYRKNKVLKITHKKRGSISLYDCFQFYNMPLNKAAEKYLGRKKAAVDASKITWANIFSDKTCEYCQIDAELCEDLAYHFYNTLPVELQDTPPISTAYLSYIYFKEELKSNVLPPEFKRSFRNAFHGGRFEVFKRGYFKDVWYYDINSAYPAEIQNLKGLQDAVYVDSKEFDPKADYAAFCINVTIPNYYISPILLERGSQIFCPIGKIKRLWLTGIELKLLAELQIPYKTIKGVNVYCTIKTYPFHGKILDLYTLKKKYFGYKIILNALYGKTAQTIDKKVRAMGTIYDDQLVWYGNKPFKVVENSSVSNFLYASYITAGAREKLYRAARKAGRDIIAVFTDCVISKKPLNLDIGENIGQWKGECWQKLYMIGSGVYFYEKEGEINYRVRGFPSIDGEKVLNKILTCNKKYVNLPIKNRVTLLESLQLEYSDIGNVIYNALKTLYINFDRKRVWLNDFRNGKELWTAEIDSLPIPLL